MASMATGEAVMSGNPPGCPERFRERLARLGGWLCGACGFAVDSADGCDCQSGRCDCESCMAGRLRERWAGFALIPARAWIASFGCKQPSEGAWVDDGLDLDGLTMAEWTAMGLVMEAVATEWKGGSHG